MKKLLLTLTIAMLGLLVRQPGNAQTPYLPPFTTYSGTTVNYVRTWIATAPGQTPASLQTGPVSDVKQTTDYYDAFGRPQMSVRKQASPLGNDMVTPHLYNSLGNEQYRFLPFVSNVAQSGDVTNNGKFKTDVYMQQELFYNSQLQNQPNEIWQANGTGPLPAYTYAYQETDYEASPLNRVLDTYAPGVSWVGTLGQTGGHNNQTEALVNTAADNVQMWSINAAQGSIPTSSGAYAAGTLHKSIAIDEQGHQVITYTDLYGQQILKKIQNTATADNGSGSNHPGWLCTYSVYDDNGNLRFVIPPDMVAQIYGSWSISQTLADELCYRFEYDALNRKVIEKDPGTPTGSGGEVWMVYDVRNRLVMRQDGNMRAGLASQSGVSQWMVYVYDALDRQVLTGTINSSNSLSTMQQQVTAQTGSNSSGTLSGAAPPTIQGNLTLSLPSMTGMWQAAQSITLAPGFSASSTFTAQIVPQSATAVNNTTVVNNNPIPSGLTLAVLTASFYDNYNWLSTAGTTLSALLNTANLGSPNITTSYLTSPVYALPIVQSNQLQGMPTGTLTAQLGSSSANLYALPMYDEYGNPIQTQSTNISGGTDIATMQFSWCGKNINKVLTHQKNGTNSQSHMVATALTYDAAGRPLSLTKTVNSSVGGIGLSTPTTTLFTNQYNERALVQQATLGNGMETEQFDYNVRGWSLGMNRSFTETAGTGQNYFGYAVGYDYGNINATGTSIGSFATPAFNGNIAGAVWKSKGDNQIRKYDYTYDVPNRLQGANFNQFDGSQFDKTAGIDYSVSGMSYDANGNIGAMNQNGWVIGGSQQIDKLSYNYLNGNVSNRLQYVADNSAYNQSNPSSSLGDFHYTGTKSSSSVDYNYDDNGNITSDANRTVSGIVYNYLNLPQTITFANNKGSISFLYDAAGNKLQKTTVENAGTVTYNNTSYPTSITTVTKYIAGFVYQSVSYGNPALASLQTTDQLQYISNEAGRVRALYTNAASPTTQTGYAFDYFIRDQTSNVRMVLTDEQWVDTYPVATVESSSVSNEENYYSINTGDVVQMGTGNTSTWWGSAGNTSYTNSNPPYTNPGDANSGAQSQYMYHLNGSTGDQFGLGITLKVMAGDNVSILGKSVWNNTGSVSEPYPLSNIVNSLLSAFAGTTPVAASHFGITGAALDGSTGITNALTTLVSPGPTQQNPSTAPNAGISWILFNDQFQPIAMNTSLVSTTGNSVYTHPQMNVPITGNGYLYVFCENESNADVYFDNLQVLQTRGHVLEEDHYYPVGLRMAGISDHAWNKLINNYRYQSKEIQDKEFSDNTGLAEYDFGSRFYDHQLGRWTTQDPAQQFENPYVGMGNKWTSGTDPDGKFWGVDDLVVSLVGFTVGYVSYGLETHHWGGKAMLEGLAGAAIAEGGYLTMGGGLASTSSLYAGAGGSLTFAPTDFAGQAALQTAEAAAGDQGLIQTAISFSSTYASSAAASFLQHGSQLQSNSWSTFGLMAGYSLMASVQAGFQSNNMQGKVDGWFPKVVPKYMAGAFSNAIGGAIANTGNSVLAAYSPSTHSWDHQALDPLNLLTDAVAGGVSSFGGQVAHNLVNSAMVDSKNTIMKNLWGNFVANLANGTTQQLLTNAGSFNPFYTDIIPGFDSNGWNALLNGGGGMPNDMVGADAFTDWP